MAEVNLIPELRFPEFNDEWEEKKLGDVLKIGSGKDYKHLNSGDIPVYGTGGFMTTVDDFIYDGESIGIGRKGTIDKPVFLSGKFWTVDTLFYTHSFKDSKPKFIFSIFQNINWKKYNEASGVPSLSKTTIEKIKINIPNPIEQQKIASFLTAIDERIQLLQKKKAKLEEYKKSVMQKLFSQDIRFKDEHGNDFPDWEEKRLGEIGDTFNGLTGKTKVDFGEGKPYVQYMQIFSNSKVNIKDFGLVKIEENENQNTVQYGDIFFTTSSETPNEIGTASVMLDEVDEVYLNSFCFGFRPNSLTELVPAFSRYLFRSELFRRKIIKLAQGSTRFNMSKVELMKLKVLLPKEKEQIKIADFLTSLDGAIEAIEAEICGSMKYKKGLLQKMFV